MQTPPVSHPHTGVSRQAPQAQDMEMDDMGGPYDTLPTPSDSATPPIAAPEAEAEASPEAEAEAEASPEAEAEASPEAEAAPEAAPTPGSRLLRLLHSEAVSVLPIISGPPPTAEPVEFIAWASHGYNAEAKNIYYPYKIETSALILNSTPLTTTFVDEFRDNIHNTPEKLLLGKCAFMPDHNGNVYLPPILFSVENPDTKLLIEYTGIWHIKSDGKSPFVVKKIFTHENFIEHGFLINKTYADVFSLIKKICTANSIPINIPWCFTVCQTPVGKTSIISPYDIIPKRSNNTPLSTHPAIILPNKTNTVEILHAHKNSLFVSPLLLWSLVNDPQTITELPVEGVVTRGCGINVFSHYGYIERRIAGGIISCLPPRGVSIFKTIDMIQQPNTAYIVLRFSTETFSTSIFNLFNAYVALKPFFMIVRTYTSSMYTTTSGESKINYAGHTVSICKNDSHIYMIDPQGRIRYYVTSAQNLLDMMKHTYKSKVVDVIFKLLDKKPSHDTHTSLSTILDAPGVSILEREPELTYGGSSTRRRTRKNKRRGSSKRKSTRKNKSRRSSKR